MTSTYLGYTLYARDLSKSLQHVADEPTSRNAKAYYDANIGKVKNVDDFINNYKLFSYAMEAAGLKDMTYAKGLMRRVLTSDLTDPRSVANKLNDSRYAAFARAYNFTTAGAVAPVSVQSTQQQSATVAAFQANTAGILDAKTSSDATAYFQSKIGSVTSIAALEKDDKLYSYVMTAYGIDPATPKSSVEAILESNRADPNSVLNKTVGAGYMALKQAVNVSVSGTASIPQDSPQSNDDIQDTVARYATTVASDANSQAAAKAETTYYGSTITTVTSVSGLTADARLVAYIKTAFGLPASVDAATLGQILTSDPTDPTSFASRSGNPAYTEVAGAFAFAADGSVEPLPFQSDGQQHSTIALYTARQSSDSATSLAATQYYQSKIGSVTSVSDLEGDPKLLSYVLTAYGIDPQTPTATIEHVLEDSLSSPTGIVDSTATSHDLSLAMAFNVDTTGAATSPAEAQTAAAIASTTTAYKAAAKTDAASQTAAGLESAYYASAVSQATSVGGLLADKRVVAFIVQAFGLPARTSADQIRQVLTGTASSTGVAADLVAKNKALAAAFNFGKTGLIVRPYARAQSVQSQAAAAVSYTRQTMEEEAGKQSTGVKLALYFQRMAPTITSAYGILADKALLQVAQTLLNLPATSARADIDTQARFIKSHLNLADFKDPKKLDKLVQRFAVMYDLSQAQSSGSNTLSLFTAKSS